MVLHQSGRKPHELAGAIEQTFVVTSVADDERKASGSLCCINSRTKTPARVGKTHPPTICRISGSQGRLLHPFKFPMLGTGKLDLRGEGSRAEKKKLSRASAGLISPESADGLHHARKHLQPSFGNKVGEGPHTLQSFSCLLRFSRFNPSHVLRVSRSRINRQRAPREGSPPKVRTR